MRHHTDPTYSERIVFDDGDHLTLTVEDPNYVTVRGRIAGETFDVDLRADAADADAEDYFIPGYDFTPEPWSPVVAVLTVGGPDIRVIRDGDDYTLVGYAPGHPGAARSSAVITRWGRLLEAHHTA